MERPHIVLVISDEHCGLVQGHLGHADVRTPVLDRLAAEGCSFARAYANSPICTQSRGTMFSGRHAHAGPVQNFWDTWKACAPSLPRMLAAAGYRTAFIGKWHLGVYHDQRMPSADSYGIRNRDWARSRTPEHHRAGFEDWQAFEVNNSPQRGLLYEGVADEPTLIEGWQADVLTDRALALMRAHDDGRPLFLVLSVEPPHFPCETPPGARTIDPASLHVPPPGAGNASLRAELAKYLQMIENVDANLERLRAAIAGDRRYAGRSVLSYISDHGDLAGTRGAVSRKEHPYEGAVRIPGIFWAPGLIAAAGAVPDRLFSIVDLLPTLLGLAGLDAPWHAQGFDWSPLLRGDRAVAGPDTVLLEQIGHPRWNLDGIDWRAFTDRRWKYAFYETGDELLYDLVADPLESDNLALSRPELLPPMRERLIALLGETRDPYFDILLRDPQVVSSARDVSGSGGMGEFLPRVVQGPHWHRITRVRFPAAAPAAAAAGTASATPMD